MWLMKAQTYLVRGFISPRPHSARFILPSQGGWSELPPLPFSSHYLLFHPYKRIEMSITFLTYPSMRVLKFKYAMEILGEGSRMSHCTYCNIHNPLKGCILQITEVFLKACVLTLLSKPEVKVKLHLSLRCDFSLLLCDGKT